MVGKAAQISAMEETTKSVMNPTITQLHTKTADPAGHKRGWECGAENIDFFCVQAFKKPKTKKLLKNFEILGWKYFKFSLKSRPHQDEV